MGGRGGKGIIGGCSRRGLGETEWGVGFGEDWRLGRDGMLVARQAVGAEVESSWWMSVGVEVRDSGFIWMVGYLVE